MLVSDRLVVTRDARSTLLVTESGFQGILNSQLARVPDGVSSNEILGVPGIGLLMHWSDFGPSLREVGVRAETVFLDCGALRRAQERELGLPHSPDDRTHLAIRIRRTQPSVVLFASHQGFSRYARLVREVSHESGRGDVRIGFHATYAGELRLSEKPDFILAATPGILSEVGRYGAPTRLWYLHAPGRRWVEEPEYYSPVHRTLDLTFIGNSGFWDDRYRWRAWVLGTLLDSELPLEIFHFGPQGAALSSLEFLREIKDSVERIARYVKTGATSALSTDSRTEISSPEQLWFPTSRPMPKGGWRRRQRLRRWRSSEIGQSAPGLPTEARLAASRITLNAHGDSIGDVGNLRMFEAAASGACLLTDRGPNLAQLFEEDHEVVSYSSTVEANEKARFLFENPRTAASIAEAARRRFERSHTSLVRAAELVDLGILPPR